MLTPAEPVNPDSPSVTKRTQRAAGLNTLLPAVLGGVAGMVDVIGFLSLGMFTAHVTGNLVVIAALVVRGGPPNMAQIMAVPVFMAAVAAVWLIAKLSGRRGPQLARLLLVVQFLLLGCVLVFSVLFDPNPRPRSVMACIAALMAVSAMACQFALLRIALPGAPSTAVMTGNVTTGMLSLLETMWPREPLLSDPEQRLDRTVAVIISFCAGCIVGAVAVSWLGPWAWSFPVALAGLATMLR